jgi:acyl-CoA thioester hydrolase
MFETGRVAILETTRDAAQLEGISFVLARISIDYHAELFWPGTVEIGTAIKSIGNSSITYMQKLYQNGKCAATAESVAVQVDNQTHRPTPLSAAAKAALQTMLLPSA